MKKNKKTHKILIVLLFFIIVFIISFYIRFMPQQSMPMGEICIVETPQPEKYKNDCLHPCIRKINDSLYCMIQSPFYSTCDTIENPIFYLSKDPRKWVNGKVIEDTPVKGYNSDPNYFMDGDRQFVFWREAYTPLCDSLNSDFVTVGIVLDSIKQKKKIYLINNMNGGDTEMCPILLKRNGEYWFYATWYQLKLNKKKNLGIAIWKGTSLDNPDFKLSDTIPFPVVYTCDRRVKIPINEEFFYLFPFPINHDMWHFDLFVYNEILYMVSVSSVNQDNIMLSISYDWKHFKTFYKPLVNCHVMHKHVGYNHFYYKPTAFVQNDSLYLYYTAFSQKERKKHTMYLSVESIKKINSIYGIQN